MEDMTINAAGDIFIAGFGADDGEMVGLCVLRGGAAQVSELRAGCQAQSLCLTPDGDILYSTARGQSSIRLLHRKN